MSLIFGIPNELDIGSILTVAGVYIGVTGNRFQNGSGNNSTLMVSDSGAFVNATLLSSTSGVLYSQTAASGTLLYNLIQGISGFDLSTFATTGSLNALSGFVLGISGALEASNTSITISGSSTLPFANVVGGQGTTVVLSGGNTIVVSAPTGYDPLGTANSNATNLSGNLTATGQALYLDIIGLSGVVAGGGNLILTGQALYSYITGLSGANIFALQNTGQTLYADVVGLSGQATITYATIANLTSSGVIIEGQLASLSGWAASALNLTLTGQALYNDIGILYNDITGLSGVLISTSGALQAQIAGGNGTQLKVTGSAVQTSVTLTGAGGVVVFLSGSTIFFSGSGAAVGSFDPLGTAALTGQILYTLVTGASGALNTAVLATGNLLNTNLGSTGHVLYAFMTGVSGQMYNVLDVTMFGAFGDAIHNDTFALQTAISYYQANNTNYSELYFPALTYFRTGLLYVTGSNLRFNGYGRATLIASGLTDYQMVNISGAGPGLSGVAWDGIGMLGGMTGNSTAAQYSGCITLINTNHVTIKNSSIKNMAGVGVLLNGYNYCPTIDGNSFENYYVGVYSQTANNSPLSWLGTGHAERVQITNNRFLNSWTSSTFNFGGGVKLQSPLANGYAIPTGYSKGNLIANNRFNNPGQMGIECWGNIADTTISANTIEGAGWGISIANGSTNITVSNNTVQAGSGSAWGIEAADSTHVTIVGNTVDGATGVNASFVPICVPGFVGIALNGVNIGSNFYDVLGNTVRACGNQAVYNIYTRYTNIIGNSLLITGTTYGGGTCFNNLGSSFVNFSQNTLSNNTANGNFFCFIDASNTITGINQPNTSGITIANNDFNGSCNQQGILLFSSTTGGNCNVLIENNRTHNVSSVGIAGKYDMVDLVVAGVNTNPAISYILRNNVGNPSGIGHFITDATVPTPTTSPSIQYNTQFTPLATGWYRLISGGYEHVGGVIRVSSLVGSAIDNNNYTDEELYFTVEGYGIANGEIKCLRHSNYNSSVLTAARIGSDGGSTVYFDILLGATGASPLIINAYGPRMQPLIVAVTSGAKVPASNVVVLPVQAGFNTTAGAFISGNTVLGGTLALQGIATAASANVGGASIPATAAGFITVSITGGSFKLPYFNT